MDNKHIKRTVQFIGVVESTKEKKHSWQGAESNSKDVLLQVEWSGKPFLVTALGIIS